MLLSDKFDWLVEEVICSIITLGFAILIMVAASLCVLGLNIFQGFLLGHAPVYQYGSLELFMFLTSVIAGVSFVLLDWWSERLRDNKRLAWLKERKEGE